MDKIAQCCLGVHGEGFFLAFRRSPPISRAYIFLGKGEDYNRFHILGRVCHGTPTASKIADPSISPYHNQVFQWGFDSSGSGILSLPCRKFWVLGIVDNAGNPPFAQLSSIHCYCICLKKRGKGENAYLVSQTVVVESFLGEVDYRDVFSLPRAIIEEIPRYQPF